MRILLSDIPLFYGMEENEIPSLLQCLAATQKTYKKGDVILGEGAVTQRIGAVLSGMAMISRGDVWGNNSILGNIAPGEVFAEVYACLPEEPMPISVSAAEDTTVMFMDAGRVLSPCANACPFHIKIVRNLLTVCAYKNLQLSQKILHTSAKSIRGRLMSYFSACAKRSGSYSFQIPYNRQQLADYLGVDRSAMCHELSKMQKEGFIEYRRNQFRLKSQIR